MMSWRCVLIYLMLGVAAGTSHATIIKSTFDEDLDGWTQMDLDFDVRYVLTPMSDGHAPGCTLDPPSKPGTLWFRDPDPGTWVFQAPAKFLGDQSKMWEGTLEWDQFWEGCDVADLPGPGVGLVLASRDTAIVLILPTPVPDEWTRMTIFFNEDMGWFWVDENTNQDDPPRATAEQIRRVLHDVTALRIIGEFYAGDDLGALDNVVMESPDEAPRLNIRLVMGNKIEVRWAESLAGYILESTQQIDDPISWKAMPTGGKTEIDLATDGSAQFFRLRKP
jgi:hypothetical protein